MCGSCVLEPLRHLFPAALAVFRFWAFMRAPAESANAHRERAGVLALLFSLTPTRKRDSRLADRDRVRDRREYPLGRASLLPAFHDVPREHRLGATAVATPASVRVLHSNALMVIVNVLPLPGSLVTVICPPIA